MCPFSFTMRIEKIVKENSLIFQKDRGGCCFVVSVPLTRNKPTEEVCIRRRLL
jgi:hypothetical protein